ncbi:ankyrin repeat family protein [Artemisia annua]|uniref:Ankyrin repeat family protein n=1 Tax=Artemisia annua TaxID=35608 RepID=A0A2U1MZZ1_ARTAN|nr:ankyrin repeat family protein [Artemisia annua]
MGGFIDGTFRDPSKISRSIRQKDKDIVKVYSEGWTLLDQRVMTLIKSSLSVILRDIVKDLKSSTEVWHALELLFTTDHENYTELYAAIISGDLQATTHELDKHGHDVELTEDGPTPLHVIIVTRKQNYEYFEKVLNHVVGKIRAEAGASTSTSTNPILVNLVNRDGRNVLHCAALVGNLHAAERLVDKDPYLLFKEDNDECLPIHVAIFTPHKDTFRYLLIESKKRSNILANVDITESFGLINPFEGKHGVRLLNAAIEAGYMEVAYQLIKMKPDIAAENDGNSFRTPLHRIVENYDKYCSLPLRWRIFDQGFLMFLLNWIVYPFNVLRYGPDRNSLREDEVAHNKALLVVRTICNRLRLQSTILEKRLHYQSAACVAACKDQHEALKEIAEHFPEVMLMEGDGYNLMELAVKYRSEKVFNFLAYETKVDTYFFKVKPKFGNSLLHYAGELTPIEKLEKDSGAALQMRKEVKWFKKVEKFALPGCDNEKNNMGETPMVVFRKEHEDLKKRGEEWMKTVANSYIIVAALIITITFAALITVPGGSQQDTGDSPVGSPAGSPVASPFVNQSSIGLPVYIKNNLFMVFVFSNVTSFCGATSALVMFLSILTSRYTEEDFINKLPWKLTIGLLALIVSLVGMLVAFGATLLLMLGHKDIFILVGIAFGIGLPVVTFIGFQVRMLWKIFR